METYMNINLIAPTFYTGYGIASFNILKELINQGHKIHYLPIGTPQAENEEDAKIIRTAFENGKLFDYNAPCIRIYHQFSLDQFIGRGKKIGFPIFELDRFNELELHHLGYPDKLFVCSEWAKEIVVESLYGHYKWPDIAKNVHVIPLGVDRKIFHSKRHEVLYPIQRDWDHENYIFLNCGKWEVRKGHDILCSMFNKAFEPTDKVELWLCPHNPFLKPEEAKEWENYYLTSKMGRAGKIKILPRLKTQVELAEVMNQADCGIFPYKAEGWNMEGLEMLSCGKPIIATEYSGPTEYLHPTVMSDSRCCLGAYPDDMEDAYDGKWFFKQGKWAKLGPAYQEQTIETMRWAAGEGFEEWEKNIEIAKKFSWENTAQKILEVL